MTDEEHLQALGLTEQQLKALKSVADREIAFQAIGRLGNTFRNIFLWVSAILATYYAFQKWVITAAKAAGKWI